MNNGAFGENFPYSNFHDLNMDWIIKIAKDFLDQYTHIQEVISNGETSLQNLTTSGLEQLQTKSDDLEALLQQWYNTHSEDIANQLADALADLNEWYDTHQNYLDETLAQKTAQFNADADAKAQQTLASIPEDYTALDSLVKQIHKGVNREIYYPINASYYPGAIDVSGNVVSSSSTYYATDVIVDNYNVLYMMATTSSGYIAFYDSSNTCIGSFSMATREAGKYYTLVLPQNTHLVKCTVSMYEGLHPSQIFYGMFTINYLINNIAKGNNHIQIESNFYPGIIDSTGSVQNSSNTYYMDFSLVDDYRYVEYAVSTNNGYYAFYDTGKQTLRTGSLEGYEIGVPAIFEVPENAVWFRITTSVYAGINKFHSYGKFTYMTKNDYLDMLPKIYHVEKDGSGDFTSLVSAIREAIRYPNSTVYVGKGTWDIISELGSAYLNTVDFNNRGLYLQNGIHVICSAQALITCNYTGSSASVHEWLAVFNAGTGGFTLENAIIEGSNIRYIIHDERDYTDPTFYHNKYINCRMKLDNSNNPDWQEMQCIGGGLGLNGYIEIDGCYFESKPVAGASAPIIIVGYHNSQDLNNLNAQSTVEMKNCFIAGRNTTFRMVGMGNSTKKSYGYVSGSRFGYAPHQAGTDNVEVIAWNNQLVLG